MLGVALNEVFVPILQKQFPEIVDFYLPPEGCSYRMAIVSIRKSYPGHAKRVMFGVWSFLRQFMYTKFIVVTDDDVDIRDWKEVVWAITTRMDPVRDTTLVDHTPIDYLDFASPVSGLGGKMGLDATNKWPGETDARMGPADPPGPGGRGARSPAIVAALAREHAAPDQRVLAALARRAPRRCAGAAPAAGACRPSRRLRRTRRRRRSPCVPACSPSDMPISTPLDQRRIAVEHRLRRAHAAGAAVAQHRSAPGHQRLDRLRGLRAGVAALHLHAPSSAAPTAACSGPAGLARLGDGVEEDVLHLLDVGERLLQRLFGQRRRRC